MQLQFGEAGLEGAGGDEGVVEAATASACIYIGVASEVRGGRDDATPTRRNEKAQAKATRAGVSTDGPTQRRQGRRMQEEAPRQPGLQCNSLQATRTECGVEPPRDPSPALTFCMLHAFRPCLVPKIFQDFPSHRILRHIHEALNINENKKLIT